MATRSKRLACLPLVLLVPALALASVVSWSDAWGGGAGGNGGGGAGAGPGSASGAAGPKKKDGSAPSRQYAGLCAQGNTKYAARDFDGAIELYRKAIELSPHQALGHYLLGETQLAAGNLAEAEASWGRAALEAGEKDPPMQARILFVTADLKEREKKWDDAKVAWQAYLDWAGRYPNAGVFPASAQSRETVLDAVIKQDKATEIVRQRIAATQDGGVFSDPSKSPPSK